MASLASGQLWGQAKAEDALLQFKEKREASPEEYQLEAYDCNEPEDTMAYPIQQQSLKIKEPVSPAKFSGTKRQNYTIIQEAIPFEYPATLCTVHRSREYYNCVWRSHVRVAAPAKIYQRETIPVEECAIMDFTGFFRDPAAERHRRLNRSAEINYFSVGNSYFFFPQKLSF